ncbi:MAG: stage III sporulation protein AA [Firmicutes bacterium]|mgnify:CR=1 FL=1|nr:stage III sporulation protein AA [Bacillota bacterium]
MFLPPAIREIMARSTLPLWTGLEEIRLRLNRPLALHGPLGALFLNPEGQSVPAERAYRPTREDLTRALALISNFSIYAFEQELRSGYLTIPGGHRVGLCGRAVLEEGKVTALTDISGLNYRIAQGIEGVALPYVEQLVIFSELRPANTLVVSPPGCGKTTFLRDLARCLSDGVPGRGIPGFKVAIVDERSEIAGCFQGLPQLRVGNRTDVLDACPKVEGMMMLLRSMAPQVIVTDEIGSPEDVLAVREVIRAGVSLVASAHGSNLARLEERPQLGMLLMEKVFERVVLLGRSQGVGTVEKIFDPRNREVFYQPAGD